MLWLGMAHRPIPMKAALAVPALLVVLLIALLLSQSGCTATSGPAELELQPSPAQGSVQQIWPAPPEIPRYRYVGELTGEQNFRQSGASEGGILSWPAAIWQWLTGIGSEAIHPVVLQRPQSGTTDAQGRIYVTDVSRQALFVFDTVAGVLRLWEFAEEGRRFMAPIGVALDDRGSVLVTDAELAAVFRFDPDGTPAGSFGQGILQRPTGIAFDPEFRQIYVADTDAHDIKVFDAAGQLLDTLGYTGDAVGRLNRPVYVAFAGNRLLVSDALNARVQVFDREGAATSVIGQRGLYIGNLTRPKGVAVDREGYVYVVEGYYDHLLVFENGGRFLMSIGGTGKRPGEFYLPTGVWTDHNNRVYVADMFNGRVSIFQFLGAEQ